MVFDPLIELVLSFSIRCLFCMITSMCVLFSKSLAGAFLGVLSWQELYPPS